MSRIPGRSPPPPPPPTEGISARSSSVGARSNDGVHLRNRSVAVGHQAARRRASQPNNLGVSVGASLHGRSASPGSISTPSYPSSLSLQSFPSSPSRSMGSTPNFSPPPGYSSAQSSPALSPEHVSQQGAARPPDVPTLEVHEGPPPAYSEVNQNPRGANAEAPPPNYSPALLTPPTYREAVPEHREASAHSHSNLPLVAQNRRDRRRAAQEERRLEQADAPREPQQRRTESQAAQRNRAERDRNNSPSSDSSSGGFFSAFRRTRDD